MRLSINHLIPDPLKDKVTAASSWVWGQELTLNQGERVLIQGPSGSGKTLFTDILYGIRKDYSGGVHWSVYNLMEANKADVSRLRASSLSIVFQDLKLFDILTVMDNIELQRGLTDTVSEYDIEKWVTRLGLKDKMYTIVKELSLGEQQRVAIIRALAQPFDWLLLDTPFSYQDSYNKGKATALINEVTSISRAGILITDTIENDCFVYDKKLML